MYLGVMRCREGGWAARPFGACPHGQGRRLTWNHSGPGSLAASFQKAQVVLFFSRSLVSPVLPSSLPLFGDAHFLSLSRNDFSLFSLSIALGQGQLIPGIINLNLSHCGSIDLGVGFPVGAESVVRGFSVVLRAKFFGGFLWFLAILSGF